MAIFSILILVSFVVLPGFGQPNDFGLFNHGTPMPTTREPTPSPTTAMPTTRRPTTANPTTAGPTKSPTVPINPVNIVFIWFDDLGFGDVGYNGADSPTPLLDELANNNAIKLNWHYSENVCSASRSAFLTGRYSWLTGVNTVVSSNTNSGIHANLTLFPQLLDNQRWRSFIAGKWHVGYSNTSQLPSKNGFRKGLYSRGVLQYYTRSSDRNIRRLDNLWGSPNQRIQDNRTDVLGDDDYTITVHDTWSIDNYDETPAYIGDTSYGEDLYTEAIRQFIRDQNGNNPFFVYFSLYTPHSSRVQPPEIRPDGTSMDYKPCYDKFTDVNSGYGNCTIDGDTRCVFCKQVNYAIKSIEDIINEIKANSNINWDQTMIVITSDNGAQPTTPGGPAAGANIPYRGVKSTSFEGGVRSPTIIKGGFIENILRSNPTLANNMCEYDGIVHISDWYHIFMDITRITDDAYEPDSDHIDLNIWDHMRCKCRNTRTTCDDDYNQRDELIMMRMCGNPRGAYDPRNGEKFFYSAYVRKGDWKLIINGSNTVGQSCTNFTHITTPSIASSWQLPDGRYFTVPNQTYYDTVYRPRFEYDEQSAIKLYKSDCLDALNGSQEINRNDWRQFRFEPGMLFNIANDPIEACVVQNNTIKRELFHYLLQRSHEYAVSTDDSASDSVIGSFKASMDSFDCTATYTVPWDGANRGNLNQIWADFIAKKKECDALSANTVGIDVHDFTTYFYLYCHQLASIVICLVFVVLIIIFYLRLSNMFHRKKSHHKIAIDSDTEDEEVNI